LAEAKNVDEVKDIRDKSIAIKEYAKQAKNKQMEADAYEIRRRAERRLGQLMEDQRETVGLAKPPGINQYVDRVEKRPEAPPTLAEAGIDKHLAHAARTTAKMPEKEFQKKIDQARNSIINGPTVKRGLGEQENYTPKNIIDAVKKVFGKIDLDPASCEKANEVVGAEKIYTLENDGLLMPWHGNVFLNPPYQHPEIKLFCEKLIMELPNINSAILLVNNNTDTQWFHFVAKESSAICFTKGRIHFYTQEIESTSPTNGQALLYFGKDILQFYSVFKDIGFICRVLNEI
jgi:hypothetical protein